VSKVGKSLLKSAEEALEYVRDNKKGSKTHKVIVPRDINVRGIRKNLHMTRKQFADEFAFSVRTLEKWERGERCPEGPTRAYLKVIACYPAQVKSALQSEKLSKDIKDK